MTRLTEPLPIFVYGTLQRGECRETCWPHSPDRVVRATTKAALYDLGAYPGIVPGTDTVQGELWFVATEHLADTLQVLDAVEGYQPGQGNSLYTREVVTCHDGMGQPQRAYTYIYARPLANHRRIAADAQGQCRWRGR